jgi:AcrR family transcriptional regulator
LLVTEINEALPGGSSLLRNEPVQARSSARLTGLLDAAAAIIDEIGFERLTTAMVAERAGASIGTVYRYFPDRIAVVEALAVRCVQRLSDSIDVAVAAADITEWRDAIDITIDRMVAMYLAEPGFRSVRFGDMETADRAVDASAGETPDETRATLADLITGLLTTRFELEATSELVFAIEVATELGSALIARAFARDPAGDARFVEECRIVVKGYLDRVVVPTP